MLYINGLNFDCLLLIFDHFSHTEQVKLRIICSKWKQAIEETFKLKRRIQIFPHQRSVAESLKCLPNSDKTDDFIIAQNCHVVKGLFPNVIHLTLWFDYSSNYADLPEYLSQNSVESLSLCGYFKPDAQLCIRILHSINRLSTLKRLDLKARNLFTSENYRSLPITVNSNVIARLEHFTYSDYFGDLLNFAVHFQKLKHLHLEHENVVAQLPAIIAANPCLTTTVTRLYLKPNNACAKQFSNLQACNFVI